LRADCVAIVARPVFVTATPEGLCGSVRDMVTALASPTPVARVFAQLGLNGPILFDPA
jgi:hypothetical protein